jgi:hypothetical protein
MSRRRKAAAAGTVSRAPQIRQRLYRIALFVAAPLVAVGLFFTPNHKRVRGWDEADARFAAAYYALLVGAVAGAGALIGLLIDPNQPVARRFDEDEDEDADGRTQGDRDD